MRTITQKLYQFEELEKEVREKVIEKYYMEEGYLFLEDDLLGELIQLDALNLFSDVKLQYSLGYCQGDGLSFSADIDKEKAISHFLKDKKESIKSALGEYIYKIYSTGNKGHYYYCSECDISIDVDYKERLHLEKLIENLMGGVKGYYTSICYKLEKYGYDTLGYMMGEKEFSDFADRNGYEYFRDGSLY